MRIGIISRTSGAAESLSAALQSAAAHEIVWIALTRGDAVARCVAHRPDLVVMDLGAGAETVQVTRQIMASAPCPILIVTDSVRRDAGPVFEAMGYGALDAIDIPSSGQRDRPEIAALLLRKVAMLARLIGSTSSDRHLRAAENRPPMPLVAMGASAGGPAALATVLVRLPKTFDASVVIVQHVDEPFTTSMSEWLSRETGHTVAIAEEDERPTPGRILMASARGHLVMRPTGRLGYTSEPSYSVYRPSIDVFFHSLCQSWQTVAVGVLLTGMGRDGALGLKALRSRGFHTIAQDQTSSAVYGMPKAAVDMGAAIEILPAECIAARLEELISVPRTASVISRAR